MNPTRSILLIIILMLATPVAKSQESGKKNLFSIEWSTMSPSDNSFANKTTFLAPSIRWEYNFSQALSAGLSVGYAYTNEKQFTRDNYDGNLVDGNTNRTLSLVPVQVNLRYLPLWNKQWALQPFVSLGAGIQYASFDISGDVINSSQTANWALVFTPEIGVRYQPRGKNLCVNLSGFMQQSNNKWSLFDTEKQNYYGVKVGVGIYLF